MGANIENSISREVVYSQLYEEMRRYRDYELTASVWYSGILLAVLVAITTVKVTNASSVPLLVFILNSFWSQFAVAFLFTTIGSASLFSIHFANLRYSKLREYVTDHLEPSWRFMPSETVVRPRHFIYVTQSLIMIAVAYTIFWPLDDKDILAILLLTACVGLAVLWLPTLVRKESNRNKPWNATRAQQATIVMAYPRHRTTAHEFYENAFSSGREVYILSIMSQSTLRQIETWLQRTQTSQTALRVLTLDPSLPKATIEAVRLHLNENADDPAKTVRQVKNAWKYWTNIAAKYPNIEVKKYSSIPTLQAILVWNTYALIELLPYDTDPHERPGLVITHNANPEVFSLFQDKCLRLWKKAT